MRVLYDFIRKHNGRFLDCFNNSITYEELRISTAKFASFVRERRITRGDTVAVAMSNSALAAEVWFGLISEGIAVVPLNPALLDEEITYILRMAEVKLIISDETLCHKTEQWSNEASRVSVVRADERPWKNYSESSGEYVDPEDVAVIFFTSGTTGRPKGAMLSHKALIENVKSCAVSYALDSSAAFACPIPIFHSLAATVCLFLPAFLGSRTYLHPPTDLKGFLNVLSELEGRRILIGVPSVLEGLLAYSGGKINNLFFTVSGGAALTPSLRERFQAASNTPLYEGYGTTECGPVISSQIPGKNNSDRSVGYPVSNVEIEIRSSDGNKLRNGETGEIVVRTPALMSGYYDLASATTASIKGGWFYTGDLGYTNDSGELFIIDRLTDAITVKGITVLPQNVEAVINSHPAVMESAVVGVPDGVGGEIPWAFVRLKKDTTVSPNELISFCKKQLPIFSAPKGVEIRDSLPKTITGKILKRTLRQKWL